MSATDFGAIKKVDVKSVWKNEQYNFTPWLAEEDNMAQLATALGLELEVEGVEVAVGPYSADILAKDVGTGRYVVVENQFGKTNHDHLGKLITYGAFLDVSAVIWLAEEFTEARFNHVARTQIRTLYFYTKTWSKRKSIMSHNICLLFVIAVITGMWIITIDTYAHIITPENKLSNGETMFQEEILLLFKLEMIEDVVKKCDAVLLRAKKEETPEDLVPLAFEYKAISLEMQGKYEEAITVWEKMAMHFGEDNKVKEKEAIAAILSRKGSLFEQLEKYEEAVKIYDELIVCFEKQSEQLIKRIVIGALNKKAAIRTKLREYEGAIKVYDDLVARFGRDGENVTQMNVVSALSEKAILLKLLKRYEEAIKVYDELIMRFGSNSAEAFKTNVAAALFAKGSLLEQLEDKEEASHAYDEIVVLFKEEQSSILKGWVAGAIRRKNRLAKQLNEE